MSSAAPDRAHVIEEHLSLVEVIARRYANRGEPLDDLVQAGSIGLIKAVDRFDPQRGTALASFAGPLIEGEIRHHLRAGRRHGAHATPASVEVVDGDDDDADRRSEAHMLIAHGWSALSPRERQLLGLRYFGDLTQAQIGDEMDLSQAQVSRLLRGALDRLRAELDADVAPRADPAYSGADMAAQEGQTEQRSTHSGRLLVRMPQSLHAELARVAEREGVSLNALVTGALAGAVAWRDGAPPHEALDEAASPDAGPEPPTRRPRWLTVALVANFAIVALAAVLAIVLLVLAWQGG